MSQRRAVLSEEAEDERVGECVQDRSASQEKDSAGVYIVLYPGSVS